METSWCLEWNLISYLCEFVFPFLWKMYSLSPPTFVLLKASFFSLFPPLGQLKKFFLIFQTSYWKVIHFVIFSWRSVYLPSRASDQHEIPSVTPKWIRYFNHAALSGGSKPIVPIRPLDPISKLKGLQGKLRIMDLVHLPHLPYEKRPEVTCSQGHS